MCTRKKAIGYYNTSSKSNMNTDAAERRRRQIFTGAAAAAAADLEYSACRRPKTPGAPPPTK